MKIRLSMPSTISSTTSVSSATQAVGSFSQTKCGARKSMIGMSVVPSACLSLIGFAAN